jgi:hypothetical protein
MVVVHSRRRAARAVVAAHPAATVSAMLVAFTAGILTAVVALLLAATAQAFAPGELVWAERLGTSAIQTGTRDMAAGPNGAVAIAGWQNLPAEERVPLVAKYGADGLEWVRTYEGRGEAHAVAFDPAGNVYVAATVTTRQYDPDIVLIKYDAGGGLRWTAVWEGDSTFGAYARGVAVDKHGDITIVGTQDMIDDLGRFIVPAVVVLKYHRDGTLAWPAAVYEPAAGDATFRTLEFSDVAFDRAGDVYVSGTLFSLWYGVDSDMEGLALRFAGADGALVASRTLESPPGIESRFASIAVRGSTVALAGMTLDMRDSGAVSDAHGLVTRFDLGLQEERRYEWDTDETKYETFEGVAVDARGDVYVTGSQASTATTDLFSQALTVKLDRSLSTVLWSAAYAPEAANAGTSLIALDANGDVCVTGVLRTGTLSDSTTRDAQDFLTIKYSRTGVRQWGATWSGGGPGYEGPRGLVLGNRRDVYVGGQAWSADGVLQVALLRYQR